MVPMDQRERSQERLRLLAFVELHWRELTLREARSLHVENLEISMQSLASINNPLTCR